MHEVLISYSKNDKRWADAACSVLEASGVRCWIAPRDIVPGAEWGAAIIAGIDACKVMVVIFSASANESPQVRREVERGISKGLTVIPCRVEDAKPVGAMEYALGNTHWLDVFTPPVERQMNRLAESVQALLPRERGASSVAVGPPIASNATGRDEGLRVSLIPTRNGRGKQRLVAAAGFVLFLLVAVSLAVVFWPRKEAASTLKNADTVGAGQTASPGKSRPAATSATPAQPLPAEPQVTKKPANDYDAIATGRWVPLLASQEDFDRVLAEKSFAGLSNAGRERRFRQGTLSLSAPAGQGNWLYFPSVEAKNVVIRAQVKKQTPRRAQIRESQLGLALRCSRGSHCAVHLMGRRSFRIGWAHSGKFEDLTTCVLPENYDEGFFELAFAATDDKLIAYVNGRKILEFAAPDLSKIPSGTVDAVVFQAGGLFQDIEVQVLDKSIVTLQTPPVR